MVRGHPNGRDGCVNAKNPGLHLAQPEVLSLGKIHVLAGPLSSCVLDETVGLERIVDSQFRQPAFLSGNVVTASSITSARGGVAGTIFF